MKNKFPFLFACCMLYLFNGSHAQIQFTRMYGSGVNDIATSVTVTNDGGYIIAGNTSGFGAGNGDLFVVKTDATGDTSWAKTYGTANADGQSTWGKGGPTIIECSGGGYLIASTRFGGINANKDAYLTRIDASGNVTWSKNYGGYGTDEIFSVMERPGGNFVFVGYLDSMFASVGVREGIYVGETDAMGNYVASAVIGDTVSGETKGFSVMPASNGIIIAGHNASWSPVSGYVNGAVMMKLDNNLNVLWQVCIDSIPGNGSEGLMAIETNDGGYALTGSVDASMTTGRDMFILKTNSSGVVQWIKTYGTVNADFAYAITQCSDDGFLICGNGAGATALVVRTDSNGNGLWSKSYSGLGGNAYDVKTTSDNGFVLAGSINTGVYNDMFMIKADSAGNTCSFPATVFPTQTTESFYTNARIYPLSITTTSVNTTTLTTSPTSYFTPDCFLDVVPEQNSADFPVQVYPNPAHDHIIAKLKDANVVSHVEIMNVLGQVVYITDVNAETTIDISDWSSGLYTLLITTNGNTSYFRLIRN